MVKQKIKVIKVPLDRNLIVDKRAHFPPLPKLYLELIENKAKIKPSCFNKEYFSSKHSTKSNDNKTSSFQDKINNLINNKNNDRVKTGDKKVSNVDKTSYKSDDNYTPDDKYVDTHKQKSDGSFSADADKYKTRDKSGEKHDDVYVDKEKTDDNLDDKYDKYYSSDDKYTSKVKQTDTSDQLTSDNLFDKYKKRGHTPLENYKSYKNDRSKEIKKSAASDLEDRLDHLLTENSDRPDEYEDKYSKKHYGISPSTYNNPPSLKELEKQGIHINREIRDVNRNSKYEQEDEDLKRELMLKIDMLRKYYPTSTIPEFNIYSEYSVMKKTYDSTVRSLSIDSQVESYEKYILIFSYIIEMLAGKFLNFDMTGFSKHQMQSMGTYKKLLIELGEKSYSPDGSNWPVEVRLLGTVIIQMAIFVFMKKMGGGLMDNLFNSAFLSQAGQQAGPFQAQNQPHTSSKKRPKMSAPNFSDIPEL